MSIISLSNLIFNLQNEHDIDEEVYLIKKSITNINKR